MGHQGPAVLVLLGPGFQLQVNRFDLLVDVVSVGREFPFLAGDLVDVDIQRRALDELGQGGLHRLLGRQGQVGLAAVVLPVLMGIEQEPDLAFSQVLAHEQVDDVQVSGSHVRALSNVGEETQPRRSRIWRFSNRLVQAP